MDEKFQELTGRNVALASIVFSIRDDFLGRVDDDYPDLVDEWSCRLLDQFSEFGDDDAMAEDFVEWALTVYV